MRRAPLMLVVGIAAIAPAGGCSSDPRQGYAFKGTHSDEIRTVSVPVFENHTYATGLEAELTEAVIKEIQRTTGWTVSQGSADATLKGSVRSSDLRRLGVDRVTGLESEVGVDMRVDFELRDNRSGRVLTARKGFGAMDSFAPSIRAGERQEIGRTATVATLARDIVAELRDAW